MDCLLVGATLKTYYHCRHLLVTPPPLPTGPGGPQGSVLVTLANLSSPSLLLPLHKKHKTESAEGGGALRGPLNTLTP